MSAREILYSAIDEHQPKCIFALFSGGGDSSVLLHAVQGWLGSELTAAVHIDTGTALPGVREHAEAICEGLDVELLVYEAGDAYERMVRKHGVPGPGAHMYAYTLLKERQIDRLVREHKQKRSDRIMLLAGARASESQRRMGKAKACDRDGAQVWVNPLLRWSNEEMRAYRELHEIPQSDASALVHRSGECNCGAFASKGEREMLQALYPDWFARVIEPRESEAADLGLPCRWGARRPGRDRANRLCQCAAQLELEIVA